MGNINDMYDRFMAILQGYRDWAEAQIEEKEAYTREKYSREDIEAADKLIAVFSAPVVDTWMKKIFIPAWLRDAGLSENGEEE